MTNVNIRSPKRSDQAELVKIAFTDDDGQVETLWAFDLGGGRYRLDSTPWFQYGVSWKDVVTVRVAFEERTGAENPILSGLQSLGCSWLDPGRAGRTEQRCRARKVGARRRGLRCYVAWEEVAGDLSSSSTRARCHQSMAMPGSATRNVRKKNVVQPKLSASAPAAGPT